MLDALKAVFRGPRPSGPTQSIRRFAASDQTVAGPPLEPHGDGWYAKLDAEQTLRLFVFEPPPLKAGVITYRLDLKTEDLDGRAYLEMLVRFPGQGEFFSKGLTDTASGTNDWSSFQVTFYLKEDQVPDQLKLNLVVEGTGQVWARAIEVEFTPHD